MKVETKQVNRLDTLKDIQSSEFANFCAMGCQSRK